VTPRGSGQGSKTGEKSSGWRGVRAYSYYQDGVGEIGFFWRRCMEGNVEVKEIGLEREEVSEH